MMRRSLFRSPRGAYVLGWSLLLIVGCQKPPSLADSGRARAALHAALEAWKRGEARGALHQQGKGIYCNDDDWAAGLRLRSYRIAETDDYFGRSCRILAQLDLENRQGTPVAKKIVYLIDTASAVVIVRDR